MPTTGEVDTFNVSQIQNRVPNPQVTEISRLAYNPSSIPQSSAPMTIDGHPYLLEFDEYGYSMRNPQPADTVGGARIIDIADPAHPSVVSDMRLAIDEPAARSAAEGDPGALSPVQGYAAHYCAIPREVDPEIVACSFINSGLRIFNIQNPLHPYEVAYYVSPPKVADENGAEASDFAMSKPAFDPAKREVWYTDGTSGFYVLKLDSNVWPDPLQAAPTTPTRQRRRRTEGTDDVCQSRRPAGRYHARPAQARREPPRGADDVHPLLDAGPKRFRLLLPVRRRPASGLPVGEAPGQAPARRALPPARADRAGSHRATASTPIAASRPAARSRRPSGDCTCTTGFKVGLNTWYVINGQRGERRPEGAAWRRRGGGHRQPNADLRPVPKTRVPALVRKLSRSRGRRIRRSRRAALDGCARGGRVTQAWMINERAQPPLSTAPVTPGSVITVYEDGPYLVRGDYVVRAQDGEKLEFTRRTIALCRCGRSRIRPLCDGSHRLIKFRAPGSRELDLSVEPGPPSATSAAARRAAPTDAGTVLRSAEHAHDLPARVAAGLLPGA